MRPKEAKETKKRNQRPKLLAFSSTGTSTVFDKSYNIVNHLDPQEEEEGEGKEEDERGARGREREGSSFIRNLHLFLFR